MKVKTKSKVKSYKVRGKKAKVRSSKSNSKSRTTKSTKSCKNCFTLDTKVHTKDGEKSIQDVKLGDRVLAKDDETGKTAYKEVINLFQRTVTEIYEIHIGKDIIETTKEHPFWVVGEGWVEVDDLKAGDHLETDDGKTVVVDNIVVKKRKTTVYNFEVAEYHSYFVSNLGVWTHNQCKVKPKYVPKGTGNRPPNLTPAGAGRNGAFREAKRNSGIPVSQQPKKVTPAVDRRGNKIPGRDYDFGDGKIIRDHSGGHKFPDEPRQNRGPHFNDVDGEHYDY